MKKLSIISLALITAGIFYTGNNAATAQKLSFGVNVGAGIPMGDYAKNDTSALPLSGGTVRYNAAHPEGYTVNDTTKYNGFAKTGFHFNVWGQYMIAGPIGLKIMIGGTMNSYDVTTFSANYEALAIKNGNSSGSFPVWTSGGSYYIGQYLIGPALKLPAGDKLRVEAQVLVGLVTGNYPTLTGTLSGTSGPASYTETATYSSASASGFGYNVNAGIEYMVAPMIGLHLNVGYTGSSFSYANYTQASSSTETIGGATSSSSSTSTYNVPKTMSMGLLQVTIGGSIDL